MPFSAKRQTGMRTNLAEAGSAVDRSHAGSAASLLHLGTDISIFWLFQCQGAADIETLTSFQPEKQSPTRDHFSYHAQL